MNGLELYELRKELGIPNRSMIARFENGHANINPRIEMLIKQYAEKHKEITNV